jgi:hypothetical protein
MFTKILCQINDVGFTRKPQTLQEYGKLREKIIQTGWQSLSEDEFVERVTLRGTAFYSCLFNGRDLMETGREKECWRMQTLIGLDFDHCTVSPEEMCAIYAEQGLDPWLCYGTFSDGTEVMEGKRSYRILWRVEPNLNATYTQVHEFIKNLAAMTPHADKNAMTVTRMWQGSRSGPIIYDPTAPELIIA